MGISTAIGIGIQFSRGGGQSWESYWLTREPSGIAVLITGATTATVTWTDSATLGADGYKVYAGATLKGTIAVGTQTASITGLTADTTYVFKVVAYKGINESTGVTTSGTTTIAAPTDIANCAYWFDLTDYATMTDDGGGVISKVIDKVTALEATATTTARPTYQTNQINGLGCLTYDGISNTLAHTSQDFGTAWSIFIVWKAKILNGVFLANGTVGYYAVNSDIATLFLPGGAGTAKVYKHYFNAAGTLWTYECLTHGAGGVFKAYERKNRTPLRENSIHPNAHLILTNLGRPTNLFFGGQAAEVIIYTSELSDTNRLKISNYLEAKYNLTSISQAPTSRLSFLGNSMTASTLGIQGGVCPYPPDLLSRVIATKGPCNYFEWAAAGWTTAQLTPYAPFVSDNHTANPKAKNDIVIVWEGTNDLVINQNAADAYTRLAAMTTPLKTAGVKVGIATIMPRSNAGLYANFEVDRQTVNQAIRDNIATIGDFVIDTGSDALMGQAGDSDNVTYYVDKVHCTSAGYSRLVTEWFYPAVIANWTD